MPLLGKAWPGLKYPRVSRCAGTASGLSCSQRDLSQGEPLLSSRLTCTHMLSAVHHRAAYLSCISCIACADRELWGPLKFSCHFWMSAVEVSHLPLFGNQTSEIFETHFLQSIYLMDNKNKLARMHSGSQRSHSGTSSDLGKD